MCPNHGHFQLQKPISLLDHGVVDYFTTHRLKRKENKIKGHVNVHVLMCMGAPSPYTHHYTF